MFSNGYFSTCFHRIIEAHAGASFGNFQSNFFGTALMYQAPVCIKTLPLKWSRILSMLWFSELFRLIESFSMPVLVLIDMMRKISINPSMSVYFCQEINCSLGQIYSIHIRFFPMQYETFFYDAFVGNFENK